MSYKFLGHQIIIDIHDYVIKQWGGIPGICPDKSLEGALNRIHTLIHYENVNCLYELAAQYCVIFAQGHIFNDGNKRTALMAMYSFLKMNGYLLYANEIETNEIVLDVAKKKLDRIMVANWLKTKCVLIKDIKEALSKIQDDLFTNKK